MYTFGVEARDPYIAFLKLLAASSMIHIRGNMYIFDRNVYTFFKHIWGCGSRPEHLVIGVVGRPAFERRGDSSKGFEAFHLTAEARIWP